MVFLGDAPPMFMASDMLSANAIGDVVCSPPASITAFVEHCYQAVLAIIEQNTPVVLALARASMNSRNGHLTGLVVDAYLSRKIQKSGIASHANAVLPLSAPASITSGRGGTGRDKVKHDRNADHLCFDFDRPGQLAGAKRARSRTSRGSRCGR